MSDKKKKKKEKYYDDGRTIVDMSLLDGRQAGAPRGKKGTPKEQLATYFAAVKTMFFPMLITIGIICVAFLLLYLILELAA